MPDKLAPLALTNLHRKAREYCDSVDALLELKIEPDESQIRRLLATLRSAEQTTQELIERLGTMVLDEGWLERHAESKRTDKRERLPTNPALDNTVQMPVVKK